MEATLQDLPAAAAGHGVAQRVAQARNGEHVEFQQLALALPVLIEKAAGAGRAGVVDQELDAVVALLQLVEQAGELQRLGQVADPEQHLDAEALAQLAGDAFQRRAFAGHQDQGIAAPGQGFGERQADAAGGAGDQGIAGHAGSPWGPQGGGEKARSLPARRPLRYCRAAQNGLTTTRMTMASRNSTGTSLNQR